MLSALFLLACHHDPGPPTCPAGQLDDAGVCVPEACGVGPWGAAERSTHAVYVLAGADGDGSEAAPFGEIAAALDAVAGGAGPQIVVGAGTYTGSLAIGGEHDDLELTGRCPELTVLRSDEQGAVVVEMERSRQNLRIAGLTVADTTHGVEVLKGHVEMEGVWLDGLRGLGLLCDGSSSEVSLRDALVRGTALDDGYAMGVYASRGCTLNVDHVRFVENTGQAIYGSDSTLVLSTVEISEGYADGHYNTTGILAFDSHTVAQHMELSNYEGLGVLLHGGSAVLSDLSFRDSIAVEDGPNGGLSIYRAVGQAEDVQMTGMSGGGIYVEQGELDLLDASIRSTTPDGSDFGIGRGISVYNGSIVAQNVEVDGSSAPGLGLDSASATLTNCSFGNADNESYWAAEGLAERPRTAHGIALLDSALVGEEISVFDNTDTGIAVFDSTVSVSGLTSTGNGLSGLTLFGGQVDGSDWTISENTWGGMLMADEGTLNLTRWSVVNTRRHASASIAIGLYAEGSLSNLSLSDGELSGTDGPGLWMAGGASLRCSDCAIHNNQFAGVGAWAGANVVLAEGTEIRDTAPHPNEGGGFGVYLTDMGLAPTVTIEDTTIGPHPMAGVYVDGDVALAVQRSTIYGSDGLERAQFRPSGQALMLMGTTTEHLSLTENVFTGSATEAVLLHGADASFGGNEWSNNTVDLWWQGCSLYPAIALPPNEPVHDAALCPLYDLAVTPIDLFINTEQFIEVAR